MKAKWMFIAVGFLMFLVLVSRHITAASM